LNSERLQTVTQHNEEYACQYKSLSLLTGFFSVVADDSGVNDGIQKLGSSLSRPPTMFETLDADAPF